MKLRIIFGLIGVASCGSIQAQVSIARTATITLGPGLAGTIGVPLPPSPYVIAPGTHVQLVAPPLTGGRTSVIWNKDGRQLPFTGLTLDLPSASSADTGQYYAVESPPSGVGVLSLVTETANLLVTADSLRLANVSNRGHIDGANSSIIAGFVVESGPGSTYVLVRAVGPALAAYGITDALPVPALRISDASGKEISPTPTGSIEGLNYPDAAKLAPLVGAFPLPAGGNDIGGIYFLKAGAYHAQLTSADGRPGTALIEIYQMTSALYESQVAPQSIPVPIPPNSTPPPPLTPGPGQPGRS